MATEIKLKGEWRELGMGQGKDNGYWVVLMEDHRWSRLADLTDQKDGFETRTVELGGVIE